MKEEAKVKGCEQEEVNGIWMQVFGSELKGQECEFGEAEGRSEAVGPSPP